MRVRALKPKWAMPLQNEVQLRSTSTVTAPFSLVILPSTCSPFPENCVASPWWMMASPWPCWDWQLHATWIPPSSLPDLSLFILWLNIILALLITLFPSQMHFTISAFSPLFATFCPPCKPIPSPSQLLPPTHPFALPLLSLNPSLSNLLALTPFSALLTPTAVIPFSALLLPSAVLHSPTLLLPQPLFPASHLAFPPQFPHRCFSGSPHFILLSLLLGPACHLLFTHSQVFPLQLCF